jgi:hypothetical protein
MPEYVVVTLTGGRQIVVPNPYRMPSVTSRFYLSELAQGQKSDVTSNTKSQVLSSLETSNYNLLARL